MYVTFWGVRGTIPCPSSDHLGYGGNTCCVSIKAADKHIILDSGTGIRLLGRHLLSHRVTEATLLITHAHHDHIHGFPYFTPAFQRQWYLRVISGKINCPDGLQGAISSYMSAPLFPVPLQTMPSTISFEEIMPRQVIELAGGVTIESAPLNHPGGASGFRISSGNRSVAYVTDTEHVAGTDDANVLWLIRGADLVIYDATFTEEDMEKHIGWGHSTWQEGVRLCRIADAKRLALFHHDPNNDDGRMAVIEAEARAAWPGAFAAREGMVMELA